MAKPILTDEQKAEYVKTGGVKCPRCGEGDISADNLEIDSPRAWGKCYCEDCHLRWVDQYKLVALVSEEEGVDEN